MKVESQKQLETFQKVLERRELSGKKQLSKLSSNMRALQKEQQNIEKERQKLNELGTKVGSLSYREQRLTRSILSHSKTQVSEKLKANGIKLLEVQSRANQVKKTVVLEGHKLEVLSTLVRRGKRAEEASREAESVDEMGILRGIVEGNPSPVVLAELSSGTGAPVESATSSSAEAKDVKAPVMEDESSFNVNWLSSNDSQVSLTVECAKEGLMADLSSSDPSTGRTLSESKNRLLAKVRSSGGENCRLKCGNS